MSVAVLLAATAGACAAVALTDGAAMLAARPARGRAGPLRRLLGALGARAGLPAPAELSARLEAAGLEGARAGEVATLKAGAGLVGATGAIWVAGALPGRVGLMAIAVLPTAAFLAPDLALRRRARARASVVARELPDVLDLLRVAVQAGLAPGRAMEEVGARAHGLLAAELRDGARRAALGEALEAVLHRLARRCPAPGVAAFAAAVRRAERHGAPLAPSLAALAADARADRARALREQAARAAPKIQLLVALGLVPGVLLLVAALLIPRIS